MAGASRHCSSTTANFRDEFKASADIEVFDAARDSEKIALLGYSSLLRRRRFINLSIRSPSQNERRSLSASKLATTMQIARSCGSRGDRFKARSFA
jgi:hypothetical protein